MSPTQVTQPHSDTSATTWVWFAVAALAVVIVMWLLSRYRRRSERALGRVRTPPLVMGVRASARVPVQPLAPAALHDAAPGAGGKAGRARRKRPGAPVEPVDGAYGPPPQGWREGPTNPLASNGSSMSDKIVHSVPTGDGTLQFLPGRLEVVDGEHPGRDIRFVRTWGEVPEITFGRVSGPPYRHVQLRSQTVSRQHARLQYTDGRWRLTNLSQTNPVIVNGDTLDTTHGQCFLRDGDQIEMGEVVFRFRER